MAWNSAPSDAATFRTLRECGLTVAGFVSPKELDLCQAAGLKAIVSDPRASHYDWRRVDEAAARSNLTSLVAEVGRHPALYGFYLIDEPGADLFPGLAKVAALVRELAPGKWPYINLFPNYASAAQLQSESYPAHLDKFNHLQHVNLQVARLAPTLLQLASDAVYHLGAVPEGSHHCAPQFRSPPKQVLMLSPYTGQLTGFGGEQQWLAPGQGVLLKPVW